MVDETAAVENTQLAEPVLLKSAPSTPLTGFENVTVKSIAVLLVGVDSDVVIESIVTSPVPGPTPGFADSVM